MSILESHNRFPDCLLMQIELVSKPSDEMKEQCDLYLTIEFNKQWKSLLDGRIELGLKGGTLEVKLENGKLKLESPLINGQFVTILTSDRTHSTWQFSPKPGDSLIKGAAKQIKLGTLIPASINFRVEATFAVSASDISLLDTEGLWKHDISPNKHGILERAIALFLLETHFKPYLSRTQLKGERLNNWQSSIQKSESHLQQIIDRIYQAPRDNFLELAKLAGLDPLQDLAGGNFLAANLSGISLNSANLYRSHFRGAVLTDADLSEANLSYAKLNGADLSGAYLENANLSYADLHNASLALGNAIAANFTGANLVGANLSNTNFSSSIVSQAIFGENPGLSEQVKQSLIERGAIALS